MDRLAETARTERPRLLAFARRLFRGRPERDAEDLLQDVLESIAQRPELGEVVEDLSAYLFRALRNRVVTLFRRKDRASSLDAGEYGAAPLDFLGDSRGLPEELLEKEELFAALDAALLTLSPEDRALVVDVELHGETHEAWAKRQKLPLGTVLSRKHRALSALRAEMEAMGFSTPFET